MYKPYLEGRPLRPYYEPRPPRRYTVACILCVASGAVGFVFVGVAGLVSVFVPDAIESPLYSGATTVGFSYLLGAVLAGACAYRWHPRDD